MPDVQMNDGFFRSILRSDAVEALTRAAAQRVLIEAKAKAPVKTGAYRDSLQIVKVHHANRDTYEVGSDRDYALLVEGRHGTLGRAVRSVRR